MNKRVIAAIAAVVLALVGLLSVALYAKSANDRAFAGAQMITVYQAVKAIPADADAEMVTASVEPVELPRKAVSEDAVDSLDEVADLRTTVPIVPGEVLIKSRFDAAGSAGAGGDSGVPEGMQEVAIALEPDAAVGTAVQPGSKVGLIATITPPGDGATPLTKMIAQSVDVTSVSGAQGEGGGIVTFAVDGKLATKIAAVVAQGGSIRLSAQNADTDLDAGGSVDARTLVK